MDITCKECGAHICFYQKDGPGELKRMYCDTIISPKNLVDKVSVRNFKDLEPIKCNNCNKALATPMIYEKEKRFALRLLVGAVAKKKITIKQFENTLKLQ